MDAKTIEVGRDRPTDEQTVFPPTEEMLLVMYGGGHVWWMLLVAVLVVVPFWQICRKAGFPGAFSLLVLVPLVNLGFLYLLAFTRWPLEERAGRRSSE